jgi:hypothetical protein
MEEDIKELCNRLRAQIQDIGGAVKPMINHSCFNPTDISYREMHAEMKANIMLAYRHLEDARMRLGKVIQHAEGGVSIYDK